MQIIKNYYGIKTDIGLFNAYQLFNTKAKTEQDHNALMIRLSHQVFFIFFKRN